MNIAYKQGQDMNLTYPEAVIFDWDGTLVDSHAIVAQALTRMYAEFGLPPISAEEAKNSPQRSLKDIFPKQFGGRWLEAREKYNAYFNEIHLEMLDPISGAHEVVHHISDLDIPLYIVSNKTQAHLDAEIKALDWHEHFHFIRGSNDGQVDKPDPEAVHHALEDSHLSPETHHIWFVGDSPVDAECAIKSGCFPIIIQEPKNISNFKYLSEPIVFVENLDSIKELLASCK